MWVVYLRRNVEVTLRQNVNCQHDIKNDLFEKNKIKFFHDFSQGILIRFVISL